MISIPDWPDVPPTQCGEGTVPLRYQDVAQDGRLRLVALSPAVGAVVWQSVIQASPLARAMRDTGVVPILSRLILEGGGGPISVQHPMRGRGALELSHAVDGNGEVSKILLNMWVDVEAPRGRTHFPPPDGAGEPIRVGRVFAEHVFSRPFGPPAERKVLSFSVSGGPSVPPLRYAWRELEDVLELPAGASALDAEPYPAPAPTVFSLGDTDSNQHVNSLVYPRIFEEAAVRRLHERGVSTRALLMRGIDIAFRKPCFAGDAMRIVVRAFRWGEGWGAAVSLGPEPEPDAAPARPHCCARLYFSDG